MNLSEYKRYSKSEVYPKGGGTKNFEPSLSVYRSYYIRINAAGMELLSNHYGKDSIDNISLLINIDQSILLIIPDNKGWKLKKKMSKRGDRIKEGIIYCRDAITENNIPTGKYRLSLSSTGKIGINWSMPI